MNNRNITAADATLICVVQDLYPAGFQFEQFSADVAGAFSDEQIAETRMGVDCQMVAGYVDQIKQITITLEPSSPSVEYMEAIMRAERAGQKKYWLTLIITLPALQKTRTLKNGVLRQGRMIADINKVLSPVTYVMDFEKIV